jgi:enoyl-CoA hydratase
MMYETLLVSVEGGLARITLNRPEVHNALNAPMFDELEQVFRELASQDSVRVVLVTGFGDRAFAAGADIRELKDLDVAAGEQKSQRGQAVFAHIEACGKPVIALINGFALGGGCELALACTFRIAAETAKLGQPEVKLGLVPGYGGTQRLPRLVGQAAALKLLLTGETIGAPEALRIGLVDEVVPGPELLRRGEELGRLIAANAPLAVKGCIEAVYEGSPMSLQEALHYEAGIFGRLCGSEDKAIGIQAFLEKRSPTWTGSDSPGRKP